MSNNPIRLLFNLTDTAVDVFKKAIADGVVLATEETSNKRIDICGTCPNLDSTTIRCKVCGCFLKTKVRFEASKCPADKW